MGERLVLVTGGTGGIGLETARAIGRTGARVIVTGRSQASGDAAMTQLRAEGVRVELVLADLSLRAQVEGLAKEVASRFGALDVLVNNAGLMPSTRVLTADGLESGFAVNVVAPLLLTSRLLPLLEASADGRVVTVTGGDVPSRVDEQNLQGERRFVGLSLYSQHKIVMMAVMHELGLRRAGRPPAFSICYPGQASTGMTRGVVAKDLPLLLRPAFPLFRLLTREDGGKSAAKAARASTFLATAPTAISGKYFGPKCDERPWPRVVLDEALRRRLFDTVSRLAGVA